MATLKRRGGKWVLRWYERTEKGEARRRWQTIGDANYISKRTAEAALAAKERELSEASRLVGANPTVAPDLSVWAKQYLNWRVLEFPDSHYRIEQIVEQYLIPEFGRYPIDTIPVEAVENYKTKRRDDGAKATTIIKELRTLHAIINRAVDLAKIPRNPLKKKVKMPKELDSKAPRFYSEDELDRIYASCAEFWHAAAWKLLANTGMRRGEAMNARRSWIKKDSVRIESTEEERTKSGQWREIPLADGAREAIRALDDVFGNDGEDYYLVPRMHLPSLSRAFIRDAKRAGVGGSMHLLRHTYISHLVVHGVPLRTVQLYAGHESFATTEKYSHLAPGYSHAVAKQMAL
jgi:integrase